MYCAKLVRSVSGLASFPLCQHNNLYSCIAVPNDLDSGGAPHSHALIDALTEAFSLAVLWSDWGIDGQVKVWTRYMDVIETHCSIIIAIYR